LLGAHDLAAIKRLAHEAVKKQWSVRETERQVRAAARGAEAKPDAKAKSANVRDLESRLSKALGARVAVEDRKGKGKLVVNYTSYDELDRILAQIIR
jgi:ParB family chromosome partitioning protein